MAEFKMPSLGADMEAGTLLEWLVKPGELVHRGDPMAVVDTDKSAVEIESFDEGVVERVLAEPGDRVTVGTAIAMLGPADGAATPSPETPAAETVPEASVATAAPPAAVPGDRAAHTPARRASPTVRHHAAELGVDIATVQGTGRGGAVTRADVDRAVARLAGQRVAPTQPSGTAPTGGPRRRISPYARRLAQELGVDLDLLPGDPHGMVRSSDVRAAALAAHAPATDGTGRGERAPVPAPRAPEARQVTKEPPRAASRATIAALMSKAKREIPHYYVATTVDMHAVTTWLRRLNRDLSVSERVVPAAALLKATALATRQFPELNGFWKDDGFEPGDDVHLGVAITVRNGALVAPAIHGTADLEITTLMGRLRDLVKRARTGRLTRAELADPTLTVTDLGDQGVEEVIGVIYPPQVALLGVGRMVERPWAVDGLLGVRPVVRLTLSGDHRATDGYTGARFLATLDRFLQHPEEL